MNQRVRDFVKNSGVRIQSPNSNNNNNNFAKELEMAMEEIEVPNKLQKNLVNNNSYNDPFVNEFKDININAFLKNAGLLTGLEMSKLNPGMFNATVDSGFGQKENIVDLKEILKNAPRPKSPIGEGLYIDTKEIKGIFGQFKTGFSHTKEAGPKGDMNKNFFTVQIMLVISNGVESKGATVNFYRNGKIRFSGGFVGTNISNQPELIRQYVVKTYTKGQPFFYNPFTYNNLSGQFRINGVFKDLTMISKYGKKYGMTSVSYEPELSPFLYAYFDKKKYIITKSGNIQISGAENPSDMLESYTFGKTFVQKLDADGMINVTGIFDGGVKTKAPPPKKKKPVSKILTKSYMNVLQINTKKCEKLKKKELVNLARQMGVMNFRTKTKDGSRMATKGEICQRIQNTSGTKKVTFKNANKNVPLVGKGNTMKVGKKLCKDLKKPEIIRVAKILNISISPTDTKVSLCKKIEQFKNKAATLSPPPPPPPKKVVPPKKMNVKKGNAMIKRRLDDKSIREDIIKLYGNKWMKRYKPNINQDIKNMKSAIKLINRKNKLNIPFKGDVDYIKKKVVERWKFERRRNLERKYLMNTVNITGIAYNMRNEYRRAAVNFIMDQKTKPTEKRMKAFRNNWLKFKNNVNNKAKTLGAKAKVEKL